MMEAVPPFMLTSRKLSFLCSMKLDYQIVEFDVRVDDKETVVYVAPVNEWFQIGFFIKMMFLRLVI